MYELLKPKGVSEGYPPSRPLKFVAIYSAHK